MANLSDFLRLGYSRKSRGVAQFGSALDWGSSGRRFKSCRPDQLDISGRPPESSKLLSLGHPKAGRVPVCQYPLSEL